MGCMFRHEPGPQCKFTNRCANRLCQFKDNNVAKNKTNYNEIVESPPSNKQDNDSVE